MDVVSKVTGNSYSAGEFNQSNNELKNAITSTGISLSSGDVFQLGKAIANMAAHGDFYSDSGAADAYVLGVIGSKQAPTAYGAGLRARFIVGNTNTGASTVNIATLGVKNITIGGVALTAGQLPAGTIAEIAFDLGNDRFELEIVTQASTTNTGIVELATDAEVKTGTDAARVAPVSAMVQHEGVQKAWVLFDGTGTIAILNSYNITSLTDHAVGEYSVNFTTAMANVNFVVGGSIGPVDVADEGYSLSPNVYAVGSIRFMVYVQGTFASTARTLVDKEFVNIQISGDI